MRMGIPHALTFRSASWFSRFWALWACFARLPIARPKTASDRTAPQLGTSEKVHAAGVDGTGAV